MSQDLLLKIEGVAKLYGWYVEEQPAKGGDRRFKVIHGDPKREIDTLRITVYLSYNGYEISIGTPERLKLSGPLFLSATLHFVFRNVLCEKPIDQ